MAVLEAGPVWSCCAGRWPHLDYRHCGLACDRGHQSSIARGHHRISLDNGLRVLLYPDPSKPTVTVNLTVLVGSRHEGYGETGMAHLLEHMVFKGTPTHPQIPKVLQERGASFNGTPGSIARTTTRRCRRPTTISSSPSIWKPIAWSTASSSKRTCCRK